VIIQGSAHTFAHLLPMASFLPTGEESFSDDRQLKGLDADLARCRQVCQSLQHGGWRQSNPTIADAQPSGQVTSRSWAHSYPASEATQQGTHPGDAYPNPGPSVGNSHVGTTQVLPWREVPRNLDNLPLSNEQLVKIRTDAAVQLAYRNSFGPQPPRFRELQATQHSYRMGKPRKVRWASARTRSFTKPYGFVGSVRPNSSEGLIPTIAEDASSWWVILWNRYTILRT
jgi:hypothetical protein